MNGPVSIASLKAIAADIRCDIIEMIATAGAGHPGGSLSAADVVVLDADVSKSVRTDEFAKRFPTRSFNFGIAEQNMMAAAAGMATTGLIPYATTYAVFASMHALDQVRNSIHYPRLNVKIASSHGGITPGPDGATYQGRIHWPSQADS